MNQKSLDALVHISKEIKPGDLLRDRKMGGLYVLGVRTRKDSAEFYAMRIEPGPAKKIVLSATEIVRDFQREVANA